MGVVYANFTSPSWKTLVDQAVKTSFALINEHWSEAYHYHNIEHTELVIFSVDRLAQDLNLPEEDRAVLIVAAAFHDSGYFEDSNDHENLGASFAAEFLKKKNASLELIMRVAHLIQCTAIHARPINRLQRLLRDADLHYVGSDSFVEKAECLREEWEQTKNLRFSEAAWIQQNIRFLEGHRFHTEVAKKRYEDRKKENLQLLKEKLTKLQEAGA